MADSLFTERRLAALYDPLDPDRSDLVVYAELVAELGANSVLDVGCGTGSFACLLVERGIDVTAVDPAIASLEIARAKTGADRVRWLHGDATTLPPLQIDLVTMTANVAQVFLTDEDWASALRGCRTALKPGGHLVFEVRDPEQQAWREWNREHSYQKAEIPIIGEVEAWVELTEVTADLVSFRWTIQFAGSGDALTSDSTLRFRNRDDITRSLLASGFIIDEIRDAPDRPGREFVFITTRT
jgi:SAM-dependent methyltransferase